MTFASKYYCLLILSKVVVKFITRLRIQNKVLQNKTLICVFKVIINSQYPSNIHAKLIVRIGHLSVTNILNSLKYLK